MMLSFDKYWLPGPDEYETIGGLNGSRDIKPWIQKIIDAKIVNYSHLHPESPVKYSFTFTQPVLYTTQ